MKRNYQEKENKVEIEFSKNYTGLHKDRLKSQLNRLKPIYMLMRKPLREKSTDNTQNNSKAACNKSYNQIQQSQQSAHSIDKVIKNINHILVNPQPNNPLEKAMIFN